jgi:hypothetical protein
MITNFYSLFTFRSKPYLCGLYTAFIHSFSKFARAAYENNEDLGKLLKGLLNSYSEYLKDQDSQDS